MSIMSQKREPKGGDDLQLSERDIIAEHGHNPTLLVESSTAMEQDAPDP